MARDVKLRIEDLRELLTAVPQTEAGTRLRNWITGEIDRREKSGRLGGRTKRDAERIEQIAQASGLDKSFDFGA